MARASATKTYNTFVKGLITEAGPLSFPENASLDEENFVLNRDGSRQRRLGIDFESGYTAIDVSTYNSVGITSVHPWGKDYVVVQVGITIHILDATTSAELYSTTLFHDWLNSPNKGYKPISIAILPERDKIVVVGEEYVPAVISVNGGVFSKEDLTITIRDTAGRDDGFAIDYRPLAGVGKALTYSALVGTFEQGETISDGSGASGKLIKLTNSVIYVINVSGTFVAGNSINGGTSGASANVDSVTNTADETNSGHILNLDNQGWSSVWQQELIDAWGVHPSNADIYHLGRDGAYNAFNPDWLISQSFGTTPAPRGASFYNVTGDVTYPPANYGTVYDATSYANRIFYAIKGNTSVPILEEGSISVLFSQQLTSENKLGKCYQDADPTSEHISDLLPTDGGLIPMPEVGNIIKLVSIAESLLVFATNGVWQILGNGEGGFAADSFQIIKISNVGAISASSIVEVEDSVMYFSKAGIYQASRPEGSFVFTTNNLSAATIQTEYNSINNSALENAFGVYDPTERKVRWLYNDESSYDGSTDKTKTTAQLILDLTLGSFYKYTISEVSGSPYVVGAFVSPSFASMSLDDKVTVSGSDVTVSGVDVTITATITQTATSRVKYITLYNNGHKMVVSEFNNTDFLDWYSYDSSGLNFVSFLDTGYELASDVVRDKQATYIVTHFNRTETGYELDGSGALVHTSPSSCLLQARWEWSDSSNSGRWGSQQQVYRFNRNYIPSGVGDAFDYGFSVITTKTKLRGRGKALSLRFESEQGKDCQLLGWGIPFTGNTEV